MDDALMNVCVVEQKPKLDSVEVTLTNVKHPNSDNLNAVGQGSSASNDTDKAKKKNIRIHILEDSNNGANTVSMPFEQTVGGKQTHVPTKIHVTSFNKDKSTSTAVSSKTIQAQVSRQDILEQMKRQISQTFENYGCNRQPEQKDSKTTIMPGTNSEYRTPGAHNVNKNGRIKRPMNAFMVWAREIRGQLATAMPNATNSDISVKLGDLWKNLPEDHKQRYYKMAEMIKQKHRQDYPDWVYRPSPAGKNNRDNSPVNRSRCSTPDAECSDHSMMQSGTSGLFENHSSHGGSSVTGRLFTQKYNPGFELRQSAPHRPIFISKNTKTRLANRLGQSQGDSRVENRCQGQPQGRCGPVNNHTAMPGPHIQLLTVNNNAILRPPDPETSVPGGGVQPVIVQPPKPVIRPLGSTPTVSVLVPQQAPDTKYVSNGQCNQQSGGESAPYRQILPNVRGISANIVPLVHVPPMPLIHTAPSAASFIVQSGLSADKPTSSVMPAASTKPTESKRPVSAKEPSTQSVENRRQPVQPSGHEFRTKQEVGHMRVSETRDIDDEDLQLDVDAFLSQIQNDDLWPFPFPETPTDDWLDDRQEHPMYMELLTPHDPFLTTEYLYSEVYPGCLHLDIDKWEKFLEEDEVVDLSEPSADDTSGADDITPSPLPLRETLFNLLGASVETSASGDVIVGDLLTEVAQEYVVTTDGEEVVTGIASLADVYPSVVDGDINSQLDGLAVGGQDVNAASSEVVQSQDADDSDVQCFTLSCERQEEIHSPRATDETGNTQSDSSTCKLDKKYDIGSDTSENMKTTESSSDVAFTYKEKKSESPPLKQPRITEYKSGTTIYGREASARAKCPSTIGGKPVLSVKPLKTSDHRNVFDIFADSTSSTMNDKRTSAAVDITDQGKAQNIDKSSHLLSKDTVQSNRTTDTKCNKLPHHTIKVDTSIVNLNKLLKSTFQPRTKQ